MFERILSFLNPKAPDLTQSNADFGPEVVAAYNNGRPSAAKVNLCNAPFNSLYFGHEGKISVCCHSRYYEVGRYPQNSISDTWNGKRIKAFREEMAKYYLGPGCAVCKNQILAGSYATVKAKQYDQYTNRPDGFPSFIEFELDNTCNLECEMCSGVFSSSIRKNRENLPPIVSPYDKAFVDQLELYIPHLEQANFLGGEPFLINTYYDVWERIVKLKPNLNIYVQTNGTVLNNRVKSLLAKANFSIGVSLDSLETDNYARIRKNAELDKVLANIDWFKAYCKEKGTYFGISVCAMPQNWHELPNLVAFANRIDVPLYFNTVLDPKHMSFETLQAEAIDEMLAVYGSVTLPGLTPKQRLNKKQFDSIINRLQFLRSKNHSHIVPISASSAFPTIKAVSELEDMLLATLEEAGRSDIEPLKQTVLEKIAAIESAVGSDELIRLLNVPTHHDRHSRSTLMIEMLRTTEVEDIVAILRKAASTTVA